MAAFHPYRPEPTIADIGVPSESRKMGTHRPPERSVGARIRVKPEHADAVATVFDREGLTPIYVERRADGAVSFWFGKLGDVGLTRVADAIPREWYSLRGIVR